MTKERPGRGVRKRVGKRVGPDGAGGGGEG
jgi:hypothetical protein